jgi:hypothetical protein
LNVAKIISICVIISILSPIARYVYFEITFTSYSKAYNSDLLDENERLTNVIEKLNQEKTNLTQQLDDAVKPYLVTNLGWYLHKSSDPVNNSRNFFTIYGNIMNTGASTAKQCSLNIKFYHNETVLQTADIYIGDIKGWSDMDINSSFGQRNEYYLNSRNIACPSADAVTSIEVTPKWS